MLRKIIMTAVSSFIFYLSCQSMGNCCVGEKQNAVDVVNLLSQSQRREYLVMGYIRSMNIRHTVPKDIKTMIDVYLNVMVSIISNTEIEQERKKLQSYDNYNVEEYQTKHKIVVLGERYVGKSSIVVRFVSNEWHLDLNGWGWEQTYATQVCIDAKTVHLDIFDPGEEPFSQFRYEWIRKSDAILLMYSVDSEYSFDRVKDLYRDIQRVKEDEIINLVLVAHKCDLPDDVWKISRQEGQQLARNWNVVYFEASSKCEVNVIDAFTELIRQIRRTKRVILDKDDTSTCIIL